MDHLVLANELKIVTPILNRDAESFFDLSQVSIVGATQSGKLQGIVRFQFDLVWY